MKRLIILLFAIIFIFACKPSTLDQVKDKWGPPAKIVESGNTVPWFYYFYAGHGRISPIATATVMKNYIVVEVIADSSGRVLKLRKYWKQPEKEPTYRE